MKFITELFKDLLQDFGGKLSDLPLRVQKEISAAEERSEKLISFVQLGAVIVFMGGYFILSKGLVPEDNIQPIPLALGAYGVYVLLRLYKNFFSSIGPVFLLFSILVDVGVFGVLIWGLHIQFDQLPAFYLKASIPFFGFALIALRTLRFEAVWVVLAGIAMAVMWAILSILAAMPEGSITWDYVEYMTSLTVHPGVEQEKIFAILVTTAVMALAVIKSRSILIKATADKSAAQELSRFFDSEVAEQITGSEQSAMSGHGVIRNAAILFTDMRGFTKIATVMEPDELIALLGDYQSLIVPIVRKHGGNIDKFLGDGIMISFGAATPSETYAADCLRAMDEMFAAIHVWREGREAKGLPAPAIGAAAAHGPVVFGVIGSESRLEYTVIGDAVNLAAKLEKHTKVENAEGLCSEAILQEAKAQGYNGDISKILEGRVVHGVNDPISIVIVQ